MIDLFSRLSCFPLFSFSHKQEQQIFVSITIQQAINMRETTTILAFYPRSIHNHISRWIAHFYRTESHYPAAEDL
ncbi:unnamed protein product [Amoebophrya sp. A25]|nr:unnamed protein product [Amoebophrya sp. A25]|eukprot:GSA25T00006363001.1